MGGREGAWFILLHSLFYTALEKVTGSQGQLVVEPRISPDEGVGDICPWYFRRPERGF